MGVLSERCIKKAEKNVCLYDIRKHKLLGAW